MKKYLFLIALILLAMSSQSANAASGWRKGQVTAYTTWSTKTISVANTAQCTSKNSGPTRGKKYTVDSSHYYYTYHKYSARVSSAGRGYMNCTVTHKANKVYWYYYKDDSKEKAAQKTLREKAQKALSGAKASAKRKSASSATISWNFKKSSNGYSASAVTICSTVPAPCKTISDLSGSYTISGLRDKAYSGSVSAVYSKSGVPGAIVIKKSFSIPKYKKASTPPPSSGTTPPPSSGTTPPSSGTTPPSSGANPPAAKKPAAPSKYDVNGFVNPTRAQTKNNMFF